MTQRSYKITIIILTVAVIALIFYSLQMRALYRESSLNQQKAVALIKQAPEQWQEQAEAFAHKLQGKAAGTFEDLMRNIKTFQQLNEESEFKISSMAEKREAALNLLKNETTPAGSYRQALKVIDVDTEILNSYQDWVKLQSMHRQRLLEKLSPLAETFGLD